MDILGLFGIIDIIIVLLLTIMIIIGWKKGFLVKFIKMANAIFGLLFSLIFAGRFANFIGPRWFNALIQPKVYANVIKSDALQNISSENLYGGITNILKELGFPGFLSDMLAKVVLVISPDLTISELQHQVATAISDQMTRFIVIIIAFLLLFIGTTILCFILKIFVKLLRTNKLFKIIDGTLGVIFMTILCFVIIYVSMIAISLLIQIPSLNEFNEFVMIDMQLSNTRFRLSKYFYENNIIGNFFKIFF